MLHLLILVQAAPPPLVVVPPVDRFDLAEVKAREGRCDVIETSSTEVLVCARRAEAPPSLAAGAEMFEPKPFRPSIGVAGGEASVAAEQRSTIMGSAPALMARFKLKF